MPAKLDIDSKMHPIFKQFFRTCPEAMRSLKQGRDTAIDLGWKINNEANNFYPAEVADVYSFEQMNGDVDMSLNMSVTHTKVSGTVMCQMVIPIYGNDHEIRAREIDEYFDFDGGYYAVDKGHVGLWTVGDYSNMVAINGNFFESHIILTMSKKIPTSDPMYNR